MDSAHRMISEEPPGPLSKPSIALLMDLPSRGATINVIQRIGAHYSIFGIFLLNDDDGTLVDALTREHHHNAEDITKAILQRWLEGKGKTPVSWATLIDVLKWVGLDELVDQLVDASFPGVSRSTPTGEKSTELEMESTALLSGTSADNQRRVATGSNSASQSGVTSPAPATPILLPLPATAGNRSAHQPSMTPEENEAYLRKFQELQVFVPKIDKLLSKLNKQPNDERRNEQFMKLRSLHSLLQDNSKRVPLQTLYKCETALKVMFEQQLTTGNRGMAIAPLSSATITSVAPSTSQDSKKLYADAMQYGYIERKVVKCLIVGAAGVGKTSIKHRILNMKLPKQRESTGVAEKPAVAISLSQPIVSRPVGISRAKLKEDGSWHVVHSDEELITMIGELINSGVPKRKQSHDNVETKVANLESAVDQNAVNLVGQDKDKMIESAQILGPAEFQEDSISNKLINAITYAKGNFQGGEKLLTSKWIHFIDSGGQPEFHDLLPVFVPNTSVVLFVFNLSEGLDEKPEIEYHGSKGRIGKSYKSYLTHKEILEHCLKVFSVQGEKVPNIMLIGTHNDHNDKKLQVTDLDKFLKTFQQGINVVQFGTQPIAMLDCLSDEDEDMVAEIRKQIMEVIEDIDSEDTPMAWFGLELALRNASQKKSSNPKGILSLEQCKQEADLLNYFKTHSGQFDAALQHLVNHNIFLHYPNVLPDVVFCDPQVLLDMVTQIVQHHYTLKHKAVNKKIAPLMDGNISADILKSIPLQCSDENGIFPLESLLKLLTYLKIISPIQKSHVMYLMPALLPIANNPAAEIPYKEKCVSPLCISFDGGCAPNGVFCSLVTTLLQSENWKLCMTERKPHCCFRNCVTFVYQEVAVITLVDFFTHFSIYLYIPTHPNTGKISPHIIRNVVHQSIRAVSNRLQYSHLKFQDAIPCPEHHDDNHVALWRQPELCGIGAAYFKCTVSDIYTGPIPDVYKDWMESTGDDTPCPSSPPAHDGSNESPPPKPPIDGGQLVANGDNTPCSPSLPVCNASNVSPPPKPPTDRGQLVANGRPIVICFPSVVDGEKKTINIIQRTGMKRKGRRESSPQRTGFCNLGSIGQPTVKLLTCFPSVVDGEKRTINIIQRTGTSFEKLGMFLLEDDNGDIIDSLKEACHHDPIQITTAVYKKWISGTGRKPVTWQTLVDVLREIDLNRVADDIDSTVKAPK